MTEPVYRDQILEIEPTGIETVTHAQRHGRPRDLFGVWFSANAEIATLMVGVFIVGLFGTGMRDAVIGIVIGNLLGFALLGVLLLQVVLAVYGYNMIHLFEKACVALRAAGFILLSNATFAHLNWAAPFNAHAPSAGGGALAGFIFATALAFSYATGWVPAASDYSRYLPEKSAPRKVFFYSFLGCAFPCIALEILGAAIVVAVPTLATTAVPTDAIASLLGNGVIAKLVLLAVVLGTLTANCMNLYSGALAALVAFSVKLPRSIVAAGVGVLGAPIAAPPRR